MGKRCFYWRGSRFGLRAQEFSIRGCIFGLQRFRSPPSQLRTASPENKFGIILLQWAVISPSHRIAFSFPFFGRWGPFLETLKQCDRGTTLCLVLAILLSLLNSNLFFFLLIPQTPRNQLKKYIYIKQIRIAQAPLYVPWKEKRK